MDLDQVVDTDGVMDVLDEFTDSFEDVCPIP